MNCIFAIIFTILLPLHAWGYPAAVSLHDKIGQMLLLGFDGKTIQAQSPIVKSIEKGEIGGVILFDYDFRSQSYNKNIESPKQVKQLNSDLQSYTKKSQLKYHRPLLPLLISVDYEGGEVSRLEERYGFPKTESAFKVAKQGPNKAQSMAKTMANTLKTAAFNLNFAPVLDVNVNPNNPVIGKKERSFSSDPAVVSKYAGIYSQQFLKKNILCVYKHFPGHGSSTQDSHLGFVNVSKSWKKVELRPYHDLIPKKWACDAIMSAHIVNKQLDDSGLPATLSHKILTGLLRNQLHFKGVIMTDDLQMKAIADNYGLERAIVLAINAGADMLIFGNNLSNKPQDPAEVIRIIEKKVRQGEISEKKINEAYDHIIQLKSALK